MAAQGARSEPLGDALVSRFGQFSAMDKFKKTAMHVREEERKTSVRFTCFLLHVTSFPQI